MLSRTTSARLLAGGVALTALALHAARDHDGDGDVDLRDAYASFDLDGNGVVGDLDGNGSVSLCETVGQAAFLGASSVMAFSQRLSGRMFQVKLPGSLQPSGEFELDLSDLTDARALEERQRDFVRLVRAEKFLRFVSCTTEALMIDPVALIAPPDVAAGDQTSTAKQFQSFAGQIAERYGTDVERDGAFTLLTATPPVDFAMHFGFPPTYPEARYAIVKDSRGASRVFWASFCVGEIKGAPPPKWPFFVTLLSEPLPPGRAKATLSYTCASNSTTDLDSAVATWFADAAREGRL